MKIRLFPLLLPVLIIVAGCDNGGTTSSPILQEQVAAGPVPTGSVAYEVITGNSVLHWRGTKLFYSRGHEGTLRVKKGTLFLHKGKLEGGIVVVDMNSISVTDIPPEQPVPLRNLTKHLEEEFEVKKYPESTFEITSVQYFTKDSLSIKGNLKIKNSVHNLEVVAQQIQGSTNELFTTEFTIDRFEWDVGTAGSWLEKRVVDREINLRLMIEVPNHFIEDSYSKPREVAMEQRQQ